MSAEKIANAPDDEVGRVLDALHRLAEGVASPLLRACLEEAAEDIAHLTGCGEKADADDDRLDEFAA